MKEIGDLTSCETSGNSGDLKDVRKELLEDLTRNRIRKNFMDSVGVGKGVLKTRPDETSGNLRTERTWARRNPRD